MVVGDVGYANPILDNSVAAAKALCAAERCDVLLLAGDLIYGPGSEAAAHWSAIWDAGLAKIGIPGVAVLGNHEWRHEPDPAKKRAAVFAADDRAGLVLPAPSFAVRLVRDGSPLIAFAALDTDSVANPGPEMPGLGEAAFDAACAQGVPVVVVGHHPPTSQGLHHTHEAHVEKQLRDLHAARTAAGCDVRMVAAGHDHDLQAYPPSCEQEGVPAVVVAGVTARGYRKGGPAHLPKCGPGPSEGRDTVYVADRGEEGGFALARIPLGSEQTRLELYTVPRTGGPAELLSTTTF
jgi:hypothetical protein